MEKQLIKETIYDLILIPLLSSLIGIGMFYWYMMNDISVKYSLIVSFYTVALFNYLIYEKIKK